MFAASSPALCVTFRVRPELTQWCISNAERAKDVALCRANFKLSNRLIMPVVVF